MPKNVRTCWHTTLSELPTPIFGIIYHTYLPSIHFLKHFEEVPFKKIQTKQKSYHPIITKNYMATATLDSSWDADICDDSGRHIWTEPPFMFAFSPKCIWWYSKQGTKAKHVSRTWSYIVMGHMGFFPLCISTLERPFPLPYT